jgi:hypothetical protein
MREDIKNVIFKLEGPLPLSHKYKMILIWEYEDNTIEEVETALFDDKKEALDFIHSQQDSFNSFNS